MNESFSKINFNKNTKSKLRKLDMTIGAITALATVLVSCVIFSFNDFQFESALEYAYTVVGGVLGAGLFFTRNEVIGGGILVGLSACVSASLIIL